MNEQEQLQKEKSFFEAIGRLYIEIMNRNDQIMQLSAQNSQLQDQLIETQNLLNQQQVGASDTQVRTGGESYVGPPQNAAPVGPIPTNMPQIIKQDD